MLVVMLTVLTAALGCVEDDQPPSCADLGCPMEPSGDPHQWAPCESDLCYCQETACLTGE